MAAISEGSFLMGTISEMLTRLKACFSWCPLSCRGFYGPRRPPIAVEEQDSPHMSPGSIWSRALLRAEETEEGRSVDLGSLEEGKRNPHRCDAVMPRENTAWSSSNAAVCPRGPSVSFDKSDEFITHVIDVRQEVPTPAFVEGGASSSSGV